MICELCFGRGIVSCPHIIDLVWNNHPCPRCGGTGRDHCCSGDQPSDHDAQEEALNRLADMGQEWDRSEG